MPVYDYVALLEHCESLKCIADLTSLSFRPNIFSNRRESWDVLTQSRLLVLGVFIDWKFSIANSQAAGQSPKEHESCPSQRKCLSQQHMPPMATCGTLWYYKMSNGVSISWQPPAPPQRCIWFLIYFVIIAAVERSSKEKVNTKYALRPGDTQEVQGKWPVPQPPLQLLGASRVQSTAILPGRCSGITVRTSKPASQGHVPRRCALTCSMVCTAS